MKVKLTEKMKDYIRNYPKLFDDPKEYYIKTAEGISYNHHFLDYDYFVVARDFNSYEYRITEGEYERCLIYKSHAEPYSEPVIFSLPEDLFEL